MNWRRQKKASGWGDYFKQRIATSGLVQITPNMSGVPGSAGGGANGQAQKIDKEWCLKV